MDIFRLIENDHEEMRSMIEKIEGLHLDGLIGERNELLQQFCYELVVHSTAEEKTFYFTLKTDARTARTAQYNQVEHELMKGELSQLFDPSLDGDDWIVRFLNLSEEIESHFDEEEQVFFRLAKRHLGERTLKNLGRQILEARDELSKVTKIEDIEAILVG